MFERAGDITVRKCGYDQALRHNGNRGREDAEATGTGLYRTGGPLTGEWDFRGIDPGEELPDIDTSVPHTARIYDYILGGKDNFAADRQAAAKAMATNPNVAKAMATRGFAPQQIEKFVFHNPLDFYRQSGRFDPKLDLPFVHPSTYQR